MTVTMKSEGPTKASFLPQLLTAKASGAKCVPLATVLDSTLMMENLESAAQYAASMP